MIHHANLTHYATMSMRELTIESNELRMLNSMMFAQMGDLTMGDPEYYAALVADNGDHDLYLSSADAVKHCLATSIGIPEFVTTVSVKRVIVEPEQGEVRRQMQLLRGTAKMGKKKKKRKRGDAASE